MMTFISATASAEVPFQHIAAQAAILVERDTGEILFEHNIHTSHPTDALNKIMTLILASYAIENDIISEHELITMTESAWYDLDEYSLTLGIEPGEAMSFIDLIYSSFVGNASEASNMIAIRMGGSIDGFVRMMNERAAEIGALNTHFVNPHGQRNPAQFTTAYDQFLIFNDAIRSSLFSEVASTFRHVTEATYESEARTLTTSNSMLNQGSRYYYRHHTAGRDTNLVEGGRSMVVYAEESGLSLISVVLGSSDQMFDDGSTDMRNFSESLRLLTWGFDNFSWRNILSTTDLLARVPVLYGSGVDFVNARPEESLSLLLNDDVPADAFVRHVTLFYDDYNQLAAPVTAGEHILGEVLITRDGLEYARIRLVANTNVSLSGLEYMRRQLVGLVFEEYEDGSRMTSIARNTLLILGVVVFIYLALLIRYHVVRANRRRRIKHAKDDLIRERHQGFRD